MKKFSLSVLLGVALGVIAKSQTSITGLPANNPRQIAWVGYNLNASTKPSLSNQSFIDSIQWLEVPLLRYPGGTISQYWDWQNGRPFPASAWAVNGGVYLNNSHVSAPMVSFPLSEYKKLLDSLNAKAVFVLNVHSRSMSDQMDMLRAAQNEGIPVEFVELGNELYFEIADFTARYPTAGSYAREMNVWTDSIKNIFPDSRIAITGTSTKPFLPNGNPVPLRIRTWNDSIYAFYNYTDAITLHNYFRHNNTIQNPDPSQVLSSAFSEWDTARVYSVNTINNGMQVWFTEYNLNDQLSNYTVATTWLHGLFTAAIHLLLLEENKISMILNHQVTGSAPYASLASYTGFGDTLTNKLTAEGNAMRLLHKAYKNKSFADKIVFSFNPSVTYNGYSRPSLTAWMMYDSTTRNIVVLNTSANTFTFGTNTLSGNLFRHETITATNIIQKDITSENLSIVTGLSSSIHIPAYSLTLLEEDTNSLTLTNTATITSFNIFPNPASSEIVVSFSELQPGSRIKIFNIFGEQLIEREVRDYHTRIHIEHLAAGIYILQSEYGVKYFTKP
jgi:hypothetical protein